MKKDEENIMTSAIPIVQTSALTKQYGQVHALNGIDLLIHSGEFIAVMGASGSGKSTLLHLIAGLTHPSSGTVCFNGTNLASLSDAELTRLRRRQIGLVFQNYNLIPQLNALDNILLPQLAEGISRKRGIQKVNKLASFLGIEKQLNQYPDTLSGGECQRVTLARALSMEPTILLADEPTGNLDTIASRQVCDIFDTLCTEEKRTILVVTHEPAVAVRANRLIILSDGKIIEDCSIAELQDPRLLADFYQERVKRTFSCIEGEEE